MLFLLFAANFLRTVLIIIAVLVIVRFIGKLMNAKRNISEQERFNKQKEAYRREKEETQRNIGKVSIFKGRKEAEDVDYEEVD
ncbi:hypothetical protein [Lishizhenia sp.]|uniref:hypothetical protein n=1 Tax=Lishizhenia sp. TaxID=2497594 RepID=UPI00299DC0F6|nr:hypothetical protein [Lishizhenia sp.]MDX1446412.1 hypothetical protein [Lishizhenia sp.]